MLVQNGVFNLNENSFIYVILCFSPPGRQGKWSGCGLNRLGSKMGNFKRVRPIRLQAGSGRPAFSHDKKEKEKEKEEDKCQIFK